MGVKTVKTARYRNPWFKGGCATEYGPAYFTTDAKPLEHCGSLIYETVKGRGWDVVNDGVCIRQMAGLNGAKRAAEAYAAGRTYPEGIAFPAVSP